MLRQPRRTSRDMPHRSARDLLALPETTTDAELPQAEREAIALAQMTNSVRQKHYCFCPSSSGGWGTLLTRCRT